ncbi:MAG: hypothetical protein FWD58_11340 [Firmicutes bacterium]|nr:hypothetical protein [Bacillota bacterium]
MDTNKPNSYTPTYTIEEIANAMNGQKNDVISNSVIDENADYLDVALIACKNNSRNLNGRLLDRR